jgi:FkbM family methyltransferase
MRSDGIARPKGKSLSNTARMVLRKHLSILICSVLIVSSTVGALVYTLVGNLAHDPHLRHRNSKALPKIGQSALRRSSTHGHTQGADNYKNTKTRTQEMGGDGMPREGREHTHTHTTTGASARGGTDSLAAAAAAASWGGPHTGAIGTSLKGVALLSDASRCGAQMGEIHQCARRKRSDCTAAAYTKCLQQAGLLENSYTALVSGVDGLFLLNVFDMYIGASLLLYGQWSHQEVEVMSLNLTPDSTVIDVGANIGAMTVPLARMVPQGKVLAFEPQRIVSQILSANIQLNGLSNVDVRRAGVGRAGRGKIDVPDIEPRSVQNFGGLSLLKSVQHNSSHSNKIRGWNSVPCVSIDSLNIPKIDLIKIDAQGMEADVLEGGRTTIARDLPILYMEYEVSSMHLYHVVQSLGPYECFHHAPPLYDADNFRKEKLNIFENVASFNVFCVARANAMVPAWLKGRNLETMHLPEVKSEGA